jgi:ribosomal protein L37E
MPERKSLMPKGGTSIDLAAAPLHWMCHSCGAGFAEKPERCSHCGGYAFERVGGKTYLREIAEAVADAIDREITIDEYGETVMGTRGPKAKTFGAEDLAERIKKDDDIDLHISIHRCMVGCGDVTSCCNSAVHKNDRMGSPRQKGKA